MDKEFLMGLEGVTEEMAEAILERHAQDLAQQRSQLQLEGAVALAISDAGGRNRKAISALLDMQALGSAEDVSAAAKEAVAQVKKECGYLFQAAPAFSAGAGGKEGGMGEEPMSLAEALKEKFFKNG